MIYIILEPCELLALNKFVKNLYISLNLNLGSKKITINKKDKLSISNCPLTCMSVKHYLIN